MPVTYITFTTVVKVNDLARKSEIKITADFKAEIED